MSRPCKVPYCHSYWYRYKEDCERELEANTQEIEDLRYEVSDLEYEVDGLRMSEVSKLSDQLSEATREWMLAERRFEDLRVENEKLEEKMSEAVQENEKLQQKLIILEQY